MTTLAQTRVHAYASCISYVIFPFLITDDVWLRKVNFYLSVRKLRLQDLLRNGQTICPDCGQVMSWTASTQKLHYWRKHRQIHDFYELSWRIFNKYLSYFKSIILLNTN